MRRGGNAPRRSTAPNYLRRKVSSQMGETTPGSSMRRYLWLSVEAAEVEFCPSGMPTAAPGWSRRVLPATAESPARRRAEPRCCYPVVMRSVWPVHRVLNRLIPCVSRQLGQPVDGQLATNAAHRHTPRQGRLRAIRLACRRSAANASRRRQRGIRFRPRRRAIKAGTSAPRCAHSEDSCGPSASVEYVPKAVSVIARRSVAWTARTA
jgi:hypothetical protein